MALKITLGDVEPLRNAHGTIDESTKRHTVLEHVQVEDMSDKAPLTLKCLSTTTWSCHWKAVKVIYEQIHNMIRALLRLKEDRDREMYRESKALIGAICDSNFAFGLLV